MKLTLFITAILLPILGLSQIPSNQVFFLNFNENTTDQINNISVVNNGLSYTIDRNNKSNSAINFSGLCNGNSGYIKVPNANSIQFSNSMTISFWAKMDLSNGMNPADGTCSATGYHMLFAKGGDGFGTSPNGIYSYLIPNGNTANNILGSTPNSGSLGYNIPITNSNDWQHFSYVVTTTNFKLYIDGQQIYSSTHSINFSEINNQDLFIGIMGPKTTPAEGVTNWYPMTGIMDDFRIFNRELNSTEINQIFNYVEPEPVVNNGPSIDQIYNLGNVKRYSHSINQFKSKMSSFEDETLINYAYYNAPNYGISLSIKKLNKDTIISQIDEGLGIKFKDQYVTIFTRDYLPNYDRNEILKINSKYHYFMGIDKAYYSTITADSLFVLNESLQLIERHSLGNVKFQHAFSKNDSLIVLSKNSDNEGIFNVSVYDINFNPIINISINDSITKYDQLNSKLVLSSRDKFYIFNDNYSSYSIFNQNLESMTVKSGRLIYQNGNNTTSLDLDTQVPTAISTVYSQLFSSSSDDEYYLLESNYFKKFGVLNQMLINKPIPIHDKIIYHKDYFLITKYDSNLNNLICTILNPEGTQITQFSLVGTQIVSFEFYGNNQFLLKSSGGLILINNLGETVWSKFINAKDLRINSDLSMWAVTDGIDIDLVHLQNPSNHCDYKVLNPYLSSYCEVMTTPQINPIFGSNIDPFTSSYPSSSYGFFYPSLGAHGIHFDWYKDNIKIDSVYLGSFIGDGVYKVKVSQGECQVFSEAKYVSLNNDLISTPILSLQIQFV
jgi:hypothetical protein